jgi:hypothetical protein
MMHSRTRSRTGVIDENEKEYTQKPKHAKLTILQVATYTGVM